MESGQLGECSVNKRLSITTTSGHLTSLPAEEHGLGGIDCPWHFKASPGQTFIFRLLNFSPRIPSDPSSSLEQHRPGCYELAIISEGIHSRSVTTCDGAVREALVYTSTTSQVQIEMANPAALSSLGKFLIHFQGTGVTMTL